MNTTTPLPPIHEKLWTVEQVARYFDCTVRHVYNLIGTGLPHLYLGRLLRFDPEEVRTYLHKTRVVRSA